MPKTFNHLYRQIADFDNLLAAYRKARRGHRFTREVLRYSANPEEELITLHNELTWQTYRTGDYRT